MLSTCAGLSLVSKIISLSMHVKSNICQFEIVRIQVAAVNDIDYSTLLLHYFYSMLNCVLSEDNT